MTTRFTLLLLIVLTFALGGCEASFSVGEQSEKDRVEEIITEQLPGEAKETLGVIEIDSVNCVEKESSRYDCLAKVSGTKTDGTPGTRSIAIDASCDKEECVWKTR